MVTEPHGKSAALGIKVLETDLGQLHEAWTKTILSNLEDPATQKNLGLLKAPVRKVIDGFLKTRELPDDVSHDFVGAIQEALSGLTKVTVTIENLRAALLAGGSPATLAELKRRFDDYLDLLAKGKEPKKVRVILE